MTPTMPEEIPEIQGWFDWMDFYWRVATEIADGSMLVELGPWLGKSTIFMGQSLQECGKLGCRIYAIDTWKGSPNEQAMFDYVLAGGSGLERFKKSTKQYGVDWVIRPVVSDSVDAAYTFGDQSVDFIFFDTEHTEERLSSELVAWRPKMKPGIWFGGHDIAVPGVRRAVEKHVKNWREVGPCWEAKNDP